MYPGCDVLSGLRKALLFLIISRTTVGLWLLSSTSILAERQPARGSGGRTRLSAAEAEQWPAPPLFVNLCKCVHLLGSSPSGQNVRGDIHHQLPQLWGPQAPTDSFIKSAEPQNHRVAGTGQPGIGFYYSDISCNDRM